MSAKQADRNICQDRGLIFVQSRKMSEIFQKDLNECFKFGGSVSQMGFKTIEFLMFDFHFVHLGQIMPQAIPVPVHLVACTLSHIIPILCEKKIAESSKSSLLA